jgi:serine protease Do
VLVRLLKIAGSDLQVFDFDYDLTWAGFFLTPDERVLGRYGGRDASGSDARLSLAGLRHAMQSALEAAREEEKVPPRGKPVLAEDYPAAKRLGNECIHCHQVYEFRREQRQKAGLWKADERWVYPLPENVGVTLNVDRGDQIKSVRAGSPAAKLDLRADDVIRRVNGVRVASQADFQYGLHKAPEKGAFEIVWRRGGKEQSGQLELTQGWRKTNTTWRPSLLDILPSLTVYGDDLTAEEKKKLGLRALQLAFRQDDKVHSHARAAGVKGGDIILGIEGEALEMTVDGFLAHVRRNYLIGDRIKLLVWRDGKRVALPMTLK